MNTITANNNSNSKCNKGRLFYVKTESIPLDKKKNLCINVFFFFFSWSYASHIAVYSISVIFFNILAPLHFYSFNDFDMECIIQKPCDFSWDSSPILHIPYHYYGHFSHAYINIKLIN